VCTLCSLWLNDFFYHKGTLRKTLSNTKEEKQLNPKLFSITNNCKLFEIGLILIANNILLNMEKTLHKRILIISLTAIVLAILAAVLVLMFSDNTIDEISPLFSIVLAFCLLSIITSAIVYKDKIWIRKISKFSLIFYPLLIIMAIPVLMFFENILNVPVSLLILISSPFFVMQLFLFADAKAITGNAIFIGLIILWLFLKRFHLPFSGYFISIIMFLFSMGSFMYGIRCFYLVGKNSFLKYAAFWCSCLIAVQFLGVLFKIQHWHGGDQFGIAANVLIILGTIVVLLTVPSSGYFDWPTVHKKIFKRLIIPWMLIFTLFIIRFLLPSVHNAIWNTPAKVTNGFEMVDYGIENKNGLVEE
jgi:hypothetical protein